MPILDRITIYACLLFVVYFGVLAGLAPLGVVCRRDQAPALLTEMLSLCRQMLPPPR